MKLSDVMIDCGKARLLQRQSASISGNLPLAKLNLVNVERVLTRNALDWKQARLMQLAAPMPSMCTWHHCTPQSPEPKWSVNPPNVINTALLMLNSFSFSFRKTKHSCAAVIPTMILLAPLIDIFRRMDRGATTTAGEVISMTIRMRIQSHGSRRQAFGTAFFYFGCFVEFQEFQLYF